MNLLERIQRAKYLSDTPLYDTTDLTSEVDPKLTFDYWAKCHNDAQMEIQNILIAAAQDYFLKAKDITITAGTQEYDLPNDTIQVRALERVDATYGNYNLYPISVNDRNVLGTNNLLSQPLMSPRMAYFFGMKFGVVDYQESCTVRDLYVKRLPDVHYGVVADLSATTITLDAAPDLGSVPSNVDDYFIGAKVTLISGTGAGQTRDITDYVGSTRVATVATWTTNPDNSTVYEIVCEIPANHHAVICNWMAMDAYITNGMEVPKDLTSKYLKSEEAMLNAFIPRHTMAPRHVARPYSRPYGGFY